MTIKKDIWNSIAKNLKSSLSTSEYDTWFSNTTLKNLDQNQALIQVPNRFVAAWLNENYLSQIQDSFKSHLDFLPTIRFTYPAKQTKRDRQQKRGATNSDIASLHQLDPLLTFATFVKAHSNRFAYSSALNVSNKRVTDYNPLYIFSELSLGKTHLLNAIGNQVISTNPLANIRYIRGDRFCSDFLSARREGEVFKFREKYRNLDLLLLDDIHLLARSKISQQELISLFNAFYESNKQMVLAGPHPPVQIHGLIPKLTSRLEWGLLSEIRTPEQKTKIKIITQRAKDKGLKLPDDVVFFLANSTNDLKSLENYLSDIQTYASIYKRQITISTVKTLLSRDNAKKIRLTDIQKAITAHFNISLSQLLSDQKRRKFSYPRQVGMYLSRRLTGLSFKEIGHAFGKKDHSTVLYAVRRMETNVRDGVSPVVDDINELLNLLS